ncbi:MAG: hypothetical protein RIQ83_3501, partial [Pseudomonadota bacterium]
LYTSKLPVTSVHVLNETVLPFFEAHEARVYTILSDNGREFCGQQKSGTPTFLIMDKSYRSIINLVINLGHPPFWVRRNATKSRATAHGLQLPICSIDPRWQQPIAANGVPYGYSNPSKTAYVSHNMT